jgi:hypothetical protein
MLERRVEARVGLVGDDLGAQASQRARRLLVVGDRHDPSYRRGADRGCDTVGGERPRQLGALRAGDSREPRLGDVGPLHGDEHDPGGFRRTDGHEA